MSTNFSAGDAPLILVRIVGRPDSAVGPVCAGSGTYPAFRLWQGPLAVSPRSTASPSAGGHRLAHVDLQEQRGFHHNGGLAMRLAITAVTSANGLCNLVRATGRLKRRSSVTDAVPEPPGKHSGGVQPLTQVAGADR
jgi:hypothetical protein